MTFKAQFWIKIALFNLLIIALLGVIMRYKIGFDFPYLTQKNILHAHSHFAFVGWISHSIYILLIFFLANRIPHFKFGSYIYLVLLNLFCAYGMLLSFFFSGYSFISIALSTLSILNNFLFTVYFYRDFNKIPHEPGIPWFKAALAFNLFSSLGTFYLAYIMSTRHFNEHLYLASVYFYLHFQYNGFFIFSCMGFAVHTVLKFLPTFKYRKYIFNLFFASCIPAYFLSTLWANLPIWLYLMVVAAAIIQLLAWLLFLRQIYVAIPEKNNLNAFSKFMFFYLAIAFSIKLLLQLGSTIPEVSKLAFGFRPVVIAYLHLVLLAIISVFLLTEFYTLKLIQTHKKVIAAISAFLGTVFLNELVLGVQGVASFSNLPIAHINEMLFVVAVMILSALIFLCYTQLKPSTQHASDF